MNEKIDYSLYLVTNSKNKRETEFLNIIEEGIKGGVNVIQIREKELDLIPFYEKAKAVKEITDKYNIPLIINDRLSIAIALGADGAHIGQSDMDCRTAREILGPNRILGVSTSNVEEAKKAEEDGANYLGCGAIFPTDTKNDATYITKEELKKIIKSVHIPVVAIGGINENNIKEFSGCDIAGISVVSAIMDSDNPKNTSKKLKKEFDSLNSN